MATRPLEKKVAIVTGAGRGTGRAIAAAYSASKFGLLGFSEALFEAVREQGVKVCVVMPGFVDTRLVPPTARIERGKMVRPEDIAAAVCFVLQSPGTSCPVEIVVRPPSGALTPEPD
jgi:NAD(P)-dependent dehydrogenase (short-subunit alcohol dehydrogenase family)